MTNDHNCCPYHASGGSAYASCGGDAAPKATFSLSSYDITLLRCGLLRRMDNLVGRPECAASYNRSKELLEILWDARKELD